MKISFILGAVALLSASCGPQALKKNSSSSNYNASNINGGGGNPSLADADCRTKLQSSTAFCHTAISQGSSSCSLCQAPPPSGLCYTAASPSGGACPQAHIAVEGGYYVVNALASAGPAWLIPASGQPMALQGNSCIYRTYGSTSVSGCSLVASELGLRMTVSPLSPNQQ